MTAAAPLAELSPHRVYKLLRGEEWAELRRGGWQTGSADDRRDGYIHLSSAAQLAGTIERYYADTSDLWLLALDPQALGKALRWEPSRGGEVFPHLYGPLDVGLCTPVATRARPDGDWQPIAFSG